MGMTLRIASSRIVGQGDIVGRSGYFSRNLSANSVMRDVYKRQILAFTLVIEGIGMLAIWGDIHGTMGMEYSRLRR